MKHLHFLAVGACIVFTGCGGGGPTSGAGTVVVPPTTSAPTPTPSASPTPTIDFTRDFVFTSVLGSASSEFRYVDSVGSTRTVQTVEDDWLPDEPVLSLKFNAGTGSLEFSYGTQGVAFSAADRLGEQYYTQNGNSLAFLTSAPPFKYVVAAYTKGPESPDVVGNNNGKRWASHVGIFGYNSTVSTRIEGALNTYTGQPLLRGGYNDNNRLRVSSLPLWINSGKNFNLGSMYLTKIENGSESPVARLDLKGTLNEATNFFSGTISDPVTGYSGTFRGALFGPNREELGILYRFSSTLAGGITYSGEMLARRDSPAN